MSHPEDTDEYVFAHDGWGYGLRMILKSSWKPKYLRAYKKAGANGLTLTFPWWRDSEIDFLAEIPGIEQISINSGKVRDVSALTELKSLRLIILHINLLRPPDLSQLPNLEAFGGEWSKRFDSIFQSTALKILYLSRYTGADLSLLEQLTELERFSLSSRKIESLSGIENFTALRIFHLYMCTKLKSLDGIEALSQSLEDLEIESCKRLHDLSPIRPLTRLKRLVLNRFDEVDSFAPLEALRDLETFRMDYPPRPTAEHDLSFLSDLPNLREGIGLIEDFAVGIVRKRAIPAIPIVYIPPRDQPPRNRR